MPMLTRNKTAYINTFAVNDFTDLETLREHIKAQYMTNDEIREWITNANPGFLTEFDRLAAEEEAELNKLAKYQLYHLFPLLGIKTF